MNHKAQLIEWLIDDIAPRVNTSGDPKGELLKFANEKNLSPALLEALGQLFNTAKTVSYLDKAANRGGKFPLLDVPDLVDEYLKVETEKRAGFNDELFDMTETGGGSYSFPKDLFSDEKLKKVAEDPEWRVFDPEVKSASRTCILKAAQVKALQQDVFNLTEDSRAIFAKWAKHFRQHPDTDFASLEADALKLHGDKAKAVTDKMASFLTASRIQVKRAADAGKERLIDTRCGFTDDVALVLKNLEKIAACQADLSAAQEAIVQNRETLHKHAGTVNDEKPKADPKKTTWELKNNQVTGSDDKVPVSNKDRNAPKEKKDLPPIPERKSNMPEMDLTPSEKSPFKTVPDEMFDFLEPVKKRWMGLAEKAVTGGYNHEQAHVDSTLADVQSAALLQNLLTTDEVLSEADPDQVVSAYNTIRQSSPGLANDVNVMRVALRSAIQHDGIDPFAVKNFADTELSRMKVDKGIKEKRDQDYGGQKPPKPKEDKE